MAQKTSYPTAVDVEIKLKTKGSQGKTIVLEVGGNEVSEIKVRWDGEIRWTCKSGPWEVLRKMKGKNPFANNKNGAKGLKDTTVTSKMVPKPNPAKKIRASFSVAVWDSTEQELYLIDPDVVVGPEEN